MRLSHVCSVAGPDDVAAVRVLRTALDRHHPGVPLTVAALPGAYFELEAIGGVDPVPISDLATDLPVRVVDLPVAVAAAVGGPLLLEHGLRDDASAVALIAPDCDVRGRLIAIEAALDRSDVVALARIDGRLCRERAAALRDAGWSPPERRGVADDLGPLQRDPRVQRMVRDAIAAGARCGVLAEPGGESHLLRWLAGPAPVGMAVGVNRYSYDLWCLRPDVQAAFPDLDGEDGARFAVWLWDHGRDEAQLDERLLPPRPAAG